MIGNWQKTESPLPGITSVARQGFDLCSKLRKKVGWELYTIFAIVHYEIEHFYIITNKDVQKP